MSQGIAALEPAAASGGTTLALQELPMGARAVIAQLRTPANVDDREVLLRLIEIGFLPGETVRVVAQARVGREPVAVRLGGQSTFALCEREAALILVRPVAGDAV